MKNPTYLTDSYAKEIKTTVSKVFEDGVALVDTVFYPQGGGQPGDNGEIIFKEVIVAVTDTKKRDGEIVHIIGAHNFKEGDEVLARINWERRYNLMRYHTSAHMVSAVVHDHSGALITGNQISEDKLRIDFALEEYDPNQLGRYVSEVNRFIAMHLDITVRFLPREEALKLPGVVKLAGALPPNIPTLRIVKIGNDEVTVDEQADGGTHVHNTRELGMLEVVGSENKGKNNRRLTVSFRK